MRCAVCRRWCWWYFCRQILICENVEDEGEIVNELVNEGVKKSA